MQRYSDEVKIVVIALSKIENLKAIHNKYR